MPATLARPITGCFILVTGERGLRWMSTSGVARRLTPLRTTVLHRSSLRVLLMPVSTGTVAGVLLTSTGTLLTCTGTLLTRTGTLLTAFTGTVNYTMGKRLLASPPKYTGKAG